MENLKDIPDKILGESVEDIANKLYDSLTESHPDAEEFRLDYLIINHSSLGAEIDPRKLEVDSKEKFIEAFLQYNREGRCIVHSFINSDGTEVIPSNKATDLAIFYNENGQYSDYFYDITKGVQNTNDFFSGFKVHRSKLKRSLIDNPFMRKLRKTAFSKYPPAESFFKNVLRKANDYIDNVAKDPFYIKIEKRLT